VEYATTFGVKIIAAIAFWLVGRWLISVVLRVLNGALDKQLVDKTALRYVTSAMNGLLNVLLVIGILGYFGIQTTTFAALIAAAGVAIGMAWSGLLANFAGGAFLIVLRPFKVGDLISAAGVTGEVKEIGLFSTTILTAGGVLTFVGNNKIFSDNIQNYSANAFRRVELKAQLSGSADADAAIAQLKNNISKIANVLTSPAIEVDILEFQPAGPVLAVRPYCHNNHYWQVYFDTNKAIRETLTSFPAPMPTQAVIVKQS
jgi:small conductance mechanosensitive channel